LAAPEGENTSRDRCKTGGYPPFVNTDEDGFMRRVALASGNYAEVNSFAGLVVGDETNFMPTPPIVVRARTLVARHNIADRVQKTRCAGGIS